MDTAGIDRIRLLYSPATISVVSWVKNIITDVSVCPVYLFSYQAMFEDSIDNILKSECSVRDTT